MTPFKQIAIWLDAFWINSAQLMFAVIFLVILVNYPRREETGQEPVAPVWINLMYPSWFDRLSVLAILKAFVLALVLSIPVGTIGMIGLLIALGRIHGP